MGGSQLESFFYPEEEDLNISYPSIKFLNPFCNEKNPQEKQTFYFNVF